MEDFKTPEEISAELKFTPPIGGYDFPVNWGCIVQVFLEKSASKKWQLTRKQFCGFMMAFEHEILVSLLLDNRGLKMNELLRQGFDFRGITIRVI